MMPWSHLAFGYVLYTLFVHVYHRSRPADAPTLALLFGTQFPDIVDKPLAWGLALLPSGRSLAHSLLVAALVITLVYAYVRVRGYGAVGVAFGIGYLSHLLGDTYEPLLAGRFEDVAFLLWPLLPITSPDDVDGLFRSLVDPSFGPEFLVKTALGLCVLLIWALDGYPGVRSVRSVATVLRNHTQSIIE